jgi:hypothetical protein
VTYLKSHCFQYINTTGMAHLKCRAIPLLPFWSSWPILGRALPLPFTTAVCFLYTAFKETARISRVRTLVSSNLRASAQEILNRFSWNCAFYTTGRHFTFLALNFLPSILTIWRTSTLRGGNDRRFQYLRLIAVVTHGNIGIVGVTMVIIVTTVARLVEIRSLGNEFRIPSCKQGTFLTMHIGTLYVFFWVIPRRLNFICRRFGTHSLFHLRRQVVPTCLWRWNR